MKKAPARLNPIEQIVATYHGGEQQAMPLRTIDIRVEIVSALVAAETVRTYRNDSERPIEAVMSFPVPVGAVFHDLEVRLDNQIYKGQALVKVKAAERYEDAVDEGRTAVLHAEVLKGVHSLSVANLAPGAEIEVTSRWTDILHADGCNGHYRIPLTVGDVYGTFSGEAVDEPTHGGEAVPTSLSVTSDAGSVHVRGLGTTDGNTSGWAGAVPADAPIDLEVSDWPQAVVAGWTAAHQSVTMNLQPAASGQANLDVAVLLDRSGSMASLCEGSGLSDASTHAAAQQGLADLGEVLRSDDRLALWEFDTSCTPVGTGQPVASRDWHGLVRQLQGPGGGTEIGGALDTVIHNTETRDILLVTDGQSYALDVHGLAGQGRRISVLLVGEASLEAKVGHLAAMTGGALHYVRGVDVGVALRTVTQGLRQPHRVALQREAAGEDGLVSLEANRNGVDIRIVSSAEAPAAEDRISRAVGALFAGLLLPALPEDEAANLAVKEGLTTHVTSLVLVTDAAVDGDQLPDTVKISIPTPRSLVLHAPPTAFAAPASLGRLHYGGSQVPHGHLSPSAESPGTAKFSASAHSRKARSRFSLRTFLDPEAKESEPWSSSLSLLLSSALARGIHWDTHASDLVQGTLDREDEWVRETINELVELDLVKQAATQLGLTPMQFVLALLAHRIADGSRHADRVLRNLLSGVDKPRFQQLAESLSRF
ncbi:MAG: VIT domain-containing protein [Caldilineaceae bacterium]|nr:VIT domain-containing protein [Caldilineaceae bacterium]